MSHSKGQDEHWMRVALALAKRGLGNVAPNPAVGCLLVKEGVVVGRGWTQPGGRPHAETGALQQSGSNAQGATAYVTLEPCAHHGHTPPCADALIEAAVARVVIAVGDPDPRVNGEGVARLKAAGIAVSTGVCETEARQVNAGFFSRVTRGRPVFTLKSATSLDGKIALASGESKWITGPAARAFGHRLRAEHDAILVGVGTVLADDPSLTCRLSGVADRNPLRVILDSDWRTPNTASVLSNDTSTLIVTTNSDAAQRKFEPSVTAAVLPSLKDVEAVASVLADHGINSVLIEGGGKVAASFFRAGLVDRVAAFQAGKVIGSDGIGAVAALKLASLTDAPHFTLRHIRRLGPDMLASYEKAG